MKRYEIHKIGLATGLAIVTTSLLSSCAPFLVSKGVRALSKTEPGREILFTLICSGVFGYSIFLAFYWLPVDSTSPLPCSTAWKLPG